jgi:asparagine synthase (glutamine-hydrolysing)
MCGIVGMCGSSAGVSPEILARMCGTLAHRGPDDDGLWTSADGSVAFGHRRLAIIDLSPGGHQPMTDGEGRCHLVFNGEIYNYRELRDELERLGHRFHSASDTEVLLEAYRAWGPDCVTRLNGMFAFALYDAAARTLFAARDRAGEKPFFYRHADGRLAFGSELKALLADPACPRVVDPRALDAYLAFGYVPYDQCMVKGVRKLPAGHALQYEVENNRLRTWRYWQLPAPHPGDVPESDLVARLHALLLDSVRRRLVADVPVGIMLSGGVDSGLVTAMAAEVTRHVRTFTVAFPGHRPYDEAPYAQAVADYLGTHHTALVAEPATVDLLPELARQFDEPLADSSMVPTYLVSRLIRREATVALGGDGGDELFGGYPHHSWIQSQARLRRYVPDVVGRTLRPVASALLPVGVRGRNYVIGLAGDESFGISQFNQLFDSALRQRLLGRRLAGGSSPEAFKASLWREGTAVQRATAVDFLSYLPDDILTKVDRASMAASLEVRAPWLDHRLIEFAFAEVPDHLRATRLARKVLPRRLAERLLPPSLDLARKQGFSLPLAAWLKGGWGAFVRDVLTSPAQDTFDHRVVRQLLAGQRRGRTNEHRLFALTLFALWRREYQMSLG